MGVPMRRPGYREAVEWLAGNDDCDWLAANAPGGISVAAAFARDLFDVEDAKLKRDIIAALRKIHPTHHALKEAAE